MKAWRFTLSRRGEWVGDWIFGITFADTKEQASELIKDKIDPDLKVEYLDEVDCMKDNIYIAGEVLPNRKSLNREMNNKIFKEE